MVGTVEVVTRARDILVIALAGDMLVASVAPMSVGSVALTSVARMFAGSVELALAARMFAGSAAPTLGAAIIQALT
jgi:hypothetical protein